MGILVRRCHHCDHWHGRLTDRCMEPGCKCAHQHDCSRETCWRVEQ